MVRESKLDTDVWETENHAGKMTKMVGTSVLPMTGFVLGLSTFVSSVLAAEDYELADLPPPYVPAIFAVVLIAGIGILTGSLGNVMDEGTS